MDIKSEVEIKGEILDIIQEEKPEMKDDILDIIEEEKQIENVNEELIFVEPLQQYFSEEEIETHFDSEENIYLPEDFKDSDESIYVPEDFKKEELQKGLVSDDQEVCNKSAEKLTEKKKVEKKTRAVKRFCCSIV
ncbi:hypothetical protein Avbf_07086 [Armadillidium vulgare]|nr:hypothetical protein Avbf_07086 [Armadillidium vulgare]